MVKKIMLWTVYVLIVGLLVFGAANRTLAKTDQGLLFGNPDEIIGGRGQGNGSIEENGEYEAADHEEVLEQQVWVTLSGLIIGVGSEALEIQTDSAGLLEIEGRSWRFAQELGYAPLEGNVVEIRGFFEDGVFELSMIRDLDSGEVMLLRDESGRPLWSGNSTH